MSKIGTVYMTAMYDDMSDPMDTIKEIKIINDLMEGNGYGTVDYPEGFSGECDD